MASIRDIQLKAVSYLFVARLVSQRSLQWEHVFIFFTSVLSAWLLAWHAHSSVNI